MQVADIRARQSVGFLLVRNFALMSYASAVEPLRAANLMASIELYNPIPLAVGGGILTSSSGAMFNCEDLAAVGPTCHTIFVCAGGSPEDWVTVKPAHAILRRLSRQGVRIGGISSGAFILAEAGLLQNRDFTVHWEHAGLFRELYPKLTPRQARYVIDRDRVTCAGGVAPLDLMHALIAERMGSHFSRRVSDWYLHTAIAEPAAPQRGSAPERFGTYNQTLLTVLEKMEATIERPLARAEMARVAGVSERHLDRLFSEHFQKGFLETYRDIRLQHARRLLEQSPLSLAEISLATGFSSPGHFSRAFRNLYSATPGTIRDEKQKENKG